MLYVSVTGNAYYKIISSDTSSVLTMDSLTINISNESLLYIKDSIRDII